MCHLHLYYQILPILMSVLGIRVGWWFPTSGGRGEAGLLNKLIIVAVNLDLNFHST